MSLADLVVECRTCGGVSIRAVGAHARCEVCGTTYEYDPDHDRLTSTDPSGERREVYGLAPCSAEDPAAVHEAPAIARFARQEVPVRYHDGLLGFVEQRGPHLPGVLRLRPDRIEFEEESGTMHTWPLLDVRAVQTASSSVQISPLAGGVVTFALEGHSPRRWEMLLRDAVAATWKAAGRGTVIEFQPRIRAE